MFRRFLPIVALLGVLAPAARADLIQWSGNGHYYDAVYVGGLGITHTSANAAAVARGGYLVSITSAEENAFVYGLVSGNDNYWYVDSNANGIGFWLGGFQTDKLAEPAGHWRWPTNEPWSYTNWDPFEPSDGWNGIIHKGEDLLTFEGDQTTKGNAWNDYNDVGWPQSIDGTQGLPRGYIVEFDTNPVPEPASLAILALGAAGLFIRRRR